MSEMRSMNKDERRNSIRKLLKSLNDDEIKSKSEKICKKLLSSKEIAGACSIAFFVPLKTEPDIVPVLKLCMKEGKKCFVPRVSDSENMEFCILNNDEALETQLEVGAFGIREPKNSLKVITCEELSKESPLILVPAMAFAPIEDSECESGRKFARLGKGRGYYDRFFASLKGEGEFTTVGIAFDFQLVDFLPTDEFDFPVDAVIID